MSSFLLPGTFDHGSDCCPESFAFIPSWVWKVRQHWGSHSHLHTSVSPTAQSPGYLRGPAPGPLGCGRSECMLLMVPAEGCPWPVGEPAILLS